MINMIAYNWYVIWVKIVNEVPWFHGTNERGQESWTLD